MVQGGTIETNLIGNEGVVGSWVALGEIRSPWRSMIQLPGEAFEMPITTFMEFMSRDGGIRKRVFRYAIAEYHLTAQSVGCNRFHELSERAARWLLTAQDRTDAPELALTHEFIAQMLGVQRPSVTIALGTLVKAGLIEVGGRGRIRIPDREALESAACECYATVRDF